MLSTHSTCRVCRAEQGGKVERVLLLFSVLEAFGEKRDIKIAQIASEAIKEIDIMNECTMKTSAGYRSGSITSGLGGFCKQNASKPASLLLELRLEALQVPRR